MHFPNSLTPEVCKLLDHHQVLKPLVRSLLIEQLVADVVVSDDNMREAENQFRLEKDLESEEDFSSWLNTQGMDASAFIAMVNAREKRRLFIEDSFGPKAEARFLDRKTQLDRVVYSLLRVDNRELANELYFRLQAGEADFAELAANYAQGPERQTRGVVGPVPLTQAHPLLAERLRTSQPGQLLQPFSIERWFLIVRLESYTAATLDTVTRQQMTLELFEEWLAQELATSLSLLQTSSSPMAPNPKP